MFSYVFVTNSTKPDEEKYHSREPVILGNMSAPCIESALKMGYEVYMGVNRKNPEHLSCSYPVHFYDSHTYRSIFDVSDNIIAYHNLSKLVRDKKIDVIHCNTPIGGMIGRLVGRKYRVKKVIYTAHGFHFYKGAPLFNQTILKWAEQLMAHWTDVIITINEEDYQFAKKLRLKKGGKVYKIHGVGITLDEFRNIGANRTEKRKELGLGEDDIALISMGDLISRKNYPTAIRAIAKCQNPKLHYYICGTGSEEAPLRWLAEELGIQTQIHFLGFRTDIKELLGAADLFLFTTKQEGLSRSLMEAMASGLPCIASDIRGNTDLLDDGKGGYLVEPNDIDGFAACISKLSADAKLRDDMRGHNLEVIQNYDIGIVKKEIQEIYDEVLR